MLPTSEIAFFVVSFCGYVPFVYSSVMVSNEEFRTFEFLHSMRADDHDFIHCLSMHHPPAHHAAHHEETYNDPKNEQDDKNNEQNQ